MSSIHHQVSRTTASEREKLTYTTFTAATRAHRVHLRSPPSSYQMPWVGEAVMRTQTRQCDQAIFPTSIPAASTHETCHDGMRTGLWGLWGLWGLFEGQGVLPFSFPIDALEALVKRPSYRRWSMCVVGPLFEISLRKSSCQLQALRSHPRVRIIVLVPTSPHVTTSPHPQRPYPRK